MGIGLFRGGWEVRDRPGYDRLLKPHRVVLRTSNFEVVDDVVAAPLTIFLLGLSCYVSDIFLRGADCFSGPYEALLS